MISGPELAKILNVTRGYIHQLTVAGLIEAEDIAAPDAKRHRFVYTETTVVRLLEDGLPRRKTDAKE